MHYTYFSIENFKGIRSLRLDLAQSGRIHTLVGLNESGKTTILEAIDLFTGGSEELDPQELAGRIRPEENDLVPIAQRANFNGQIRIEAGIHLDPEDVTALVSFMRLMHKIDLRDVPIDFSVTDEYHFSNSLYMDKGTMWPSQLGSARSTKERKDWPFSKTRYDEEWKGALTFIRNRMPAIWYFPNFLFEFPGRIYLRPQTNEPPTDRFYRALLQDVLDALNLDATLEAHVLARALSEEPADRRALNLILQMSRRLSLDVFEAWNQILRRKVNMRVSLSVGKEVTDEDEVEPYIEVD